MAELQDHSHTQNCIAGYSFRCRRSPCTNELCGPFAKQMVLQLRTIDLKTTILSRTPPQFCILCCSSPAARFPSTFNSACLLCTGKSQTKLGTILMDLRKCCNHPLLFDDSRFSGPPQEADKLVADSGKLRLLDRMLAKLRAQGHRTLIYSQFTMVGCSLGQGS